jgi:hypothetical protein
MTNLLWTGNDFSLLEYLSSISRSYFCKSLFEHNDTGTFYLDFPKLH